VEVEQQELTILFATIVGTMQRVRTNNMRYTAYEYLYALYAGLQLTGETEKGNPEWLGNDEQWRKYLDLVKKYEQSLGKTV